MDERQQGPAQVELMLKDACTKGDWGAGKGMPGRRNSMCRGPGRIGTLDAPDQAVTAAHDYPGSSGIPSHMPLKSMPKVTPLKAVGSHLRLMA